MRRTYYKDYGFDKKEIKRLREYCKDMDDEDKEILRQAAESSNANIAEYLYESIINHLSYDDLDKDKYIPIGKEDFYGYQRLCMVKFCNLLVFAGKFKR